MEANLIDRDVAENYFGCSDWEILAKETLREVPLVDAAPVRHGHWIFEEDEEKSWCTKAICSACGNIVENNLGLSIDTRRQYFLEDNHYCRVCGALMDEAVDMMLERWKEAIE